jgi:hypothetical protein
MPHSQNRQEKVSAKFCFLSVRWLFPQSSQEKLALRMLMGGAQGWAELGRSQGSAYRNRTVPKQPHSDCRDNLPLSTIKLNPLPCFKEYR